MPFECDVCGEEVSYSERVFKLRNGAKIVICKKCLNNAEEEMEFKSIMKTVERAVKDIQKKFGISKETLAQLSSGALCLLYKDATTHEEVKKE